MFVSTYCLRWCMTKFSIGVSPGLSSTATCCFFCDRRLLFQNVECAYKNSKRRDLSLYQVSFIPSILRVAMPVQGTKQKCSLQDAGVVDTLESGLVPLAQSGADTRKKAKMGVENTGIVCLNSTIDALLILWSQARRSLRENKGNGGQIAQLQNLERMQTATSHRVSKMDLATDNEPLNPMAPSTRNPKSRGSKTSGSVVGDFSSFIFYFFFTNEQAASANQPSPVQNWQRVVQSHRL